MNPGSDRGFQRRHIVIRETDDYVGTRHEEPPAAPETPWIRNLLQPIAFTILVACVVWPLAQLLAGLSPLLDPTILRLIPTVMALVGFTTQRVVSQRFLSGTESMRFRLIELGVLLLVTKAAALLGNTAAQFITLARTWSRNPFSFFDAGTITAFLLGTTLWWGGSATARDLDAVRDPSLYVGEAEPLGRLANRYFLGGVLLMISAAANRVDIVSVITLEQERTRAPIVSALIYFLLGLVMLGQIRFARLVSLWHRDRVTVSKSLSINWLRYLLVFLALIAGVAFVLPTGYTVSILDLATFIITLIMWLLMLLYILIAWPFALLVGLLMGKPNSVQPPAVDNLPIRPDMVVPSDGGANPWLVVLRSALFWSVLIGAVFHLVRSYVRDRPELRRLAQGITPLRWASRIWRALRSWLRKVRKTASGVLPTLTARIRHARVNRQSHRLNTSPFGLREEILDHYLRTLEVAQEAGLPRGRAETPYEYRGSLQEHLEEETEALADLTEAFIEARYSTHPISPESAAAQQSNAQRIQRSLLERHKT